MTPPVVRTPATVRSAVASAWQRGLAVGLVPTMGALHAGHVSLIQAARQETGFVVVSIFVNPTQFGPAEDFERYPRTLENDLALCLQEGVDLVFAPGLQEMYPDRFSTFVEVTGLQDVLCGATRPGHFRGVATVVLKLLNVVQPEIVYFGQKDGQQVRIIEQMMHDLHVPAIMRVCPTVREADGLALSSRNRYLDPAQRRAAPVLYQALQEARQSIESGERDASAVARTMVERITSADGAAIDYVSLVDARNLTPANPLRGDVLIAVAVKFGATRLIDNIRVSVPVS